MTELYGIDDYGGKLTLASVEVSKETPKTYRVLSFREFLGYKSILSKEHDTHLIFFNPDEAIEAYIKNQKRRIQHTQEQLSRLQDNLSQAKELRMIAKRENNDRP